MPRTENFVDGERIRKARTLRRAEPIYEHLAMALASVPELTFIKLFSGRLTASNRLSTDGKKNPIVAVGGEDISGVELLIDADAHVVQFYTITSTTQGWGHKMVEAVVRATPTIGSSPSPWIGAVASGSAWRGTMRVCKCSEAPDAVVGLLPHPVHLIGWSLGTRTESYT